MDIDPRIAQTIVENIKGVIRHDINFFDAHGKMIASTDATRIGTFHDAARLAAERKRTVAVDGDNQFIGARNGINAPVIRLSRSSASPASGTKSSHSAS